MKQNQVGSGYIGFSTSWLAQNVRDFFPANCIEFLLVELNFYVCCDWQEQLLLSVHTLGFHDSVFLEWKPEKLIQLVLVELFLHFYIDIYIFYFTGKVCCFLGLCEVSDAYSLCSYSTFCHFWWSCYSRFGNLACNMEFKPSLLRQWSRPLPRRLWRPGRIASCVFALWLHFHGNRITYCVTPASS